jgi:O-antigen ligase
LQRTIEVAATRSGNRVSVATVPEFGRALTFGFASLVMGLSLLMTRSRSGIAALAAGSLIALWIMLRRQRSLAARAAVVVSFLVVLGGAAAWAGLDTMVDKALSADQTNDSLGGRLGAWKDTFRIIRDFPLAGTGFNTYGTAMTMYQTHRRDLHFQEAHNDYLQIAAEGGLLLIVPVLLAIGIFVRDVRRRFREAPREGTTYWLRVGAVIALLSIGLQSLVEFSLQMPGNAAMFAAIAAMALQQSPNLRRMRSGGPPLGE